MDIFNIGMIYVDYFYDVIFCIVDMIEEEVKGVYE